MNLKKKLPEKVTTWTVTPDGYGGYMFGSPVVHDHARWENRAELYRNSEGEEVVSTAVIYLLDLPGINSMIYRGESSATDPTTLTGVEQVKQYTQVSDLRGINTLVKVMV